MLPLTCYPWHMTCHMWHVKHGGGKYFMKFQVTSFFFFFFCDTWHKTCDTWHMTHDTLHRTCDMWHKGEVNILSKFRIFSLALLKLLNYFSPSFAWIFTQKECKSEMKKNYDKTLYVWSTNFTPVKKKFTQPLLVMLETFRMSDYYIVFFLYCWLLRYGFLKKLL